jgi:hypothetical protein
MKSVVLLVAALISSLTLVSGEAIPPWSQIKKTERGAKLLKIVEALHQHQDKQGVPAPTLISLVSLGFLKEEDLCLKNPDTSLSIPDYFPAKPGHTRPAETIVLRMDSEDRTYEIIVRADLSIEGIAPRKPLSSAGGDSRSSSPE